MDDQPTKVILTVAELNRRSKDILETQIANVRVCGELSNFITPSSGHWYFSLKDAQAQVRCVMFASVNHRCQVQIKEGIKILVSAKVTLYEGRGQYQLIVNELTHSGSGALQQALEDLKKKLEAQGLFDKDRKTKLPKLPRRVGLITSPTGTVVADMINILKRRAPHIAITLFPTIVQGRQAAPSLIARLHCANQQPPEHRCDVLILARGGGYSIEDLWTFNDEALAQAIVASNIPVISAVGHDTNHSISDYCADLRAATPSEAAEIVSQYAVSMKTQFADLGKTLQKFINRRTTNYQRYIVLLRKGLRTPQEQVQRHAQKLDYLNEGLWKAIERQLSSGKLKLNYLQQVLRQQQPSRMLEQHRQQHLQLTRSLRQQMTLIQDIKGNELKRQQELLNAYNPLQVLDRGYSILLDADNKAIIKTHQVTSQQLLTALLSDGSIKVKVT